VDLTKAEKDLVLRKNQKLYKDKTESEVSRNKLMMTMTVLIALVVILIVLFVYYTFLAPKTN